LYIHVTTFKKAQKHTKIKKHVFKTFIKNIKKRFFISMVYDELYWLNVPERITYKNLQAG